MRLADAQTGPATEGLLVSLPHTSGGAGVAVGGVTDRCPRCIELRKRRHEAWIVLDFGAELSVRRSWFAHYDQEHAGRWEEVNHE
ncbi:hypothetical protein ACIHFE_18185 [Streptomyces sp. NPDC052396]|uniref:hypothetical protein n=1 Tax=Streptomyces sp. NPDC052396 TaxID=3365689 RepID=UPI0037CF631D